MQSQVSPVTTTVPTPSSQAVTIPSEPLLFPRNKRNVWDLFFGQSPATLAEKCDSQFAKINKNFARVYQSEQTLKRILSEATHQFKALTEQEKTLDMKGLSLKFLI